jgi:hypothetical protein
MASARSFSRIARRDRHARPRRASSPASAAPMPLEAPTSQTRLPCQSVIFGFIA